jgi:hypothetical protein
MPSNDRVAVRVGWIAAIAYNSWPLAYLCNRMVLQHGLASDLEKFNQPFSWVFIAGDIATGVLLMAAAYLQYPRANYKLLRLLILSYGAFGAIIIMAAVLPIKCEQVAAACVERLASPAALLHSSFSIISILSLSLAVLLCLILRRVTGSKVWQLWPLIITAVAMPVFGITALIDIIEGNHHNELQYIFISVTGLAIWLSVRSVSQLSKVKAPTLRLRTLRRSLRAGRSFYP